QRPRLRGCQVRPGPVHLPAGGILRGVGMCGGVGRFDRRGGGVSCARIAGRRLTVEGQVKDLSERLARVLRRREALPLARGQEQRLSIWREQDDPAELAALAAGRVALDDLEVLERRGGSAREPRAGKRQSTPAVP